MRNERQCPVDIVAVDQFGDDADMSWRKFFDYLAALLIAFGIAELLRVLGLAPVSAAARPYVMGMFGALGLAFLTLALWTRRKSKQVRRP